MKKILACCLAAMALSLPGRAQVSRYIVDFRDKASGPFTLANPSAYLSQRAIDRRLRYGIAIDSSDLPVTPRYLDSVRLAGNVTILNASRWLNSVSIRTTDTAALTRISRLPFVRSVTGIALRTASPLPAGDKFAGEKKQTPPPPAKDMGLSSDYYNYGSSYDQVHIHNGEFLHNIGLRGETLLIGMLDAGFNNYLTVKAFDSARANGQILGVYDFVAHDSSVNEDDAHGMECFSTIAANIPGQMVGTAPRAHYYLFRTEDAATEYPIEEHNWVCGAERMDSAGGDLISSSLGYSTFDAPLAGSSHSYADMNGNTTMAAIGADLAAKKGILVVNAAGNYGNSTWHYIVTPADADSVLAVGAVSTSGSVASFSSYGPSSDGQVKPDVASVGLATILQFPNNTIGASSGTSFACPNMAGLTTCLWQGFPEANNMAIIEALRRSGSRATAPDDRVGYGIPDMKKAVMVLLKEFAVSSATVANCTATLQWQSRDLHGMKYEIERKVPGQTAYLRVGQLNAKGTLFGPVVNYGFQDVLSGVSAGTISYRIREIIDTSAAGFFADYIDTVSLTLPSACIDTARTDVTLLPNPAGATVTIRVTTPSASSSIAIRIYNSLGQLVLVADRTKLAGTAFYDSISLARLAKGRYFVSVYDNSRLLATRELIRL